MRTKERVGFTPGPWRATQYDPRGYGRPMLSDWRVVADKSYAKPQRTAIAPIAGLELQGPESEANARLIAAAPDLLAACKAAIAYDAAIQRYAERGQSWVEGDDLDALYSAWIDSARAAVAKAEGTAPDA